MLTTNRKKSLGWIHYRSLALGPLFDVAPVNAFLSCKIEFTLYLLASFKKYRYRNIFSCICSHCSASSLSVLPAALSGLLRVRDDSPSRLKADVELLRSGGGAVLQSRGKQEILQTLQPASQSFSPLPNFPVRPLKTSEPMGFNFFSTNPSLYLGVKQCVLYICDLCWAWFSEKYEECRAASQMEGWCGTGTIRSIYDYWYSFISIFNLPKLWWHCLKHHHVLLFLFLFHIPWSLGLFISFIHNSRVKTKMHSPHYITVYYYVAVSRL